MAEVLDFISALINVLNVLILMVLLYVFTKNYRHIRSGYTLGLIIFTLIFLAENLIMLHLGIFEWPSVIEDIVEIHMIIINSIELLGLFVLLLITWD